MRYGLAHAQVGVSIAGQLRKVGDAKDLPASPAVSLGETQQFVSHHAADAPADALIDLVKDQDRDAVSAREGSLEGQHEA